MVHPARAGASVVLAFSTDLGAPARGLSWQCPGTPSPGHRHAL